MRALPTSMTMVMLPSHVLGPKYANPAATRAISVRFRWQPRARGSRLRIESFSRHLSADAGVPFVVLIGPVDHILMPRGVDKQRATCAI